MKKEVRELREYLRQLRIALRPWGPLNYRHTHETKVTGWGQDVGWIPHELPFVLHELRGHGHSFWRDPETRKWCWGYEVHYSGSRWDPPSSDWVDGEEEFDRLDQVIEFLATRLFRHYLSETLQDTSMYLGMTEEEEGVL